MSHPFDTLTPDLVLDAVESLGFLSDARVLALNSYENRVYQVGIEDAQPLIAKFYRPGRWSDAAILEEHAFTAELADCEVPVVAPMQHDDRTLFEHKGFRFTLFPRRGGHAPNLATSTSCIAWASYLAACMPWAPANRSSTARHWLWTTLATPR